MSLKSLKNIRNCSYLSFSEHSLTFVSSVETLDLEPEEIVHFTDGRCLLNDGTRLSGKLVALDPLVVQTRYGMMQVPSA